MLRRQRHIRIRVQKAIDAGLFSLSLWIAHYFRQQSGFAVLGGTPQIQGFEEYLWLIVLVFPVTWLLLDANGFYNRIMPSRRRTTAWQLFKVCVIEVLVVVTVMFLLKEQLARSVIILFGGISFLVVLFKEEMLRRWMQSSWGQSQSKKRLLLVGTKADTQRFLNEAKSYPDSNLEIVAELDLNETSIEALIELLHLHSVNGVILSARHTFFGQIEKAIQACELEGVEAWLLADFFNTQVSQTTLDDFNGRPLLVFRTTPEESWQAFAKQLLDVFGALGLLFLFAPFFLLAPVLIKLTSPGPILFRQQRSGLNGRPFTMLKFRSMSSDAEQRKQELAALNEMGGPVFKLTDDPRITRVGKYLRRYSIDELPQLLNVLRGEMSLVGPRPLPVDEVMRFDDLAHRRRLSVKPGITCLWQVSGRNNVRDFKDWVRLDLEYIDNWSLWLDLKILARTVPVVLMGTGAK